jgi:hypothetical protein
MNMNKKIIIIIIAAIIIGAAAYVVFGLEKTPADSKRYENKEYGISFYYPKGYTLIEGEIGNAERGHYVVAIVSDADAVPRENSEGPVATSIDIYQNNIDKQSTAEWLKNTNFSNFKLSDGTYASTTLSKKDAIKYRWSGLYEAETNVVLHKDNIVALTITYITPQDSIFKVYNQIVNSIKFK